MLGIAKSQLMVADGIAGVSGKPIRIFSIHILAAGADVPEIKLYSGIATGGTIYVQQKGTANTGATFEFGENGFLFPNGCYYEEVTDAHVTSTLITFTQEN
jgi:hypothetical protein